MTKPYFIETDYADAAHLFRKFARTPMSILLDSPPHAGGEARYSYIGLDPFLTLDGETAGFGTIQSTLKSFKMARHPDLAPFQGGVMGYLGYEMLHDIETVAGVQGAAPLFPHLCLGFYDVVAAFDHEQKTAHIFSSGFSKDGSIDPEKARERAHRMRDKLAETDAPPSAEMGPIDWQHEFSQAEYEQAVARVIDYICAGDIFQANLTQRFLGDLPDGFQPFAFYERLRKLNPAPFSAFMNGADFQLASSSPERFLKLVGQEVETCPIKGTRPRLSDKTADAQQVQALHQSEKDRAENTMIADLLRNDLSKVCKPRSVRVPALCEVHSFASVHHLISTVCATLKDDADGLDLLKACFPGGSITGAPKVRAMEIISELEKCPRGPYCGGLGYIGFDGDMDMNIIIRTALFKDQKVALQVGGGIVADSQPALEYQETLDKARALFDAFDRGVSA